MFSRPAELSTGMLASLGKGMHLQCLGMGSELLRRAAGWGLTGRDLTSRVFQDGLPHHMQLHVRDVAQPRSAQGHEAFLCCIPECFAECLLEQWQQPGRRFAFVIRGMPAAAWAAGAGCCPQCGMPVVLWHTNRPLVWQVWSNLQEVAVPSCHRAAGAPPV